MNIKKEAIKRQAVSLAEKFKKFCVRQKKNSDQRLLNHYKAVVEDIRAVSKEESVSNAIVLVTLDRERDRLEKKIKRRGLDLPPAAGQNSL